ncbi:hypothetical protein [Aestuariispira insulae]|uniref:Uncharacterized protein n=1 Tax=Aestuariispira insulae TaxID=1461337 RepID=A0A3D9H2I6_9PROT|nr:hypothetical protein [Aestuariispira insulae]RED43695.1 hypothetical protein DFP90_1216 [Aestuariispira insulae]
MLVSQDQQAPLEPGDHISDERCALLADIGFAAIELEMGQTCEPLFQLLISIFPDNASAYVGAAFSCLHRQGEDAARDYVAGEALTCGSSQEMAWGVLLYLARRNPDRDDPDAVLSAMEIHLEDSHLGAAVSLADELTGTIDDGGTSDPDFSRLPKWIWKRL